jgi:Domain of unknown function (DUF397)
MSSNTTYDDWRKASYSNGSGSCVETASADGTVAVRDTTDRDGVTLSIAAGAWQAFTDGLK